MTNKQNMFAMVKHLKMEHSRNCNVNINVNICSFTSLIVHVVLSPNSNLKDK